MISIGLFAIVVVVVVALSLSKVNPAVSRARLTRFARRQCLTITPANGNHVIRYLATTRRWRATGLVTGVLAGFAWSLPGGQLNASFTAMFSGWFVGAVLAEWRVAALPSGPRRAAVLQPRLARDYLGGPARWLPVMSAAACAILALAGLIGVLRGGHGGGRIVAWGVGAVVGLVIIGLVQQHVLLRPQPPAPAAVLAADEAIRGRALQVLAGSAVAAGGIPAAALLTLLTNAYPGLDPQAISLTSPVLLCAAAFVGWQVAVTPSPVRRVFPSLDAGRLGSVPRP